MSTGLIRHHITGDLHVVTFSCFRHRPVLGTPHARDTVLHLLEQFRSSYKFDVIGYIVMPDHVHLLLSEPETKPLSTAIQVLKQTFSRTRQEAEVWETRYYDFNVYTETRRIEKLRYIHRNPVTRSLVAKPDQWSWNSFRHYAEHHPTPVKIASSIQGTPS